MIWKSLTNVLQKATIVGPAELEKYFFKNPRLIGLKLVLLLKSAFICLMVCEKYFLNIRFLVLEKIFLKVQVYYSDSPWKNILWKTSFKVLIVLAKKYSLEIHVFFFWSYSPWKKYSFKHQDCGPDCPRTFFFKILFLEKDFLLNSRLLNYGY